LPQPPDDREKYSHIERQVWELTCCSLVSFSCLAVSQFRLAQSTVWLWMYLHEQAAGEAAQVAMAQQLPVRWCRVLDAPRSRVDARRSLAKLFVVEQQTDGECSCRRPPEGEPR
jgi:hypothetical protein